HHYPEPFGRPSAFPSASIRLGQTLPVNSSSCPLFLQICVMECEGRLPSSATWDLCSKMPSRKVSLRPGLDHAEDGSEWPLEKWDGGLLGGGGGLKPLGDLARAVDLSQADDEKQGSKLSGLLRQPEAEGDGGHGGRVPPGALQGHREVPRRMSDFLSGPFSYGQLAEPGVQELQKRFGGFIGVRKSARKWHNQKRFSEFLKQYLGMAPRSVEYDDFPDDAKEKLFFFYFVEDRQ
uniref:Prepronociceptin n=1 Tax=Varanus komodoensis TaxID=61221 RepID=A0A8D2ILB7_VARKO